MNNHEMLEMNKKDLAHHHYLCAWSADLPEIKESQSKKKLNKNKTQSMTTSSRRLTFKDKFAWQRKMVLLFTN